MGKVTALEQELENILAKPFDRVAVPSGVFTGYQLTHGVVADFVKLIIPVVEAEVQKGREQLADETMDALRDPTHSLHKKIMGHITEALEQGRKEGITQATGFINAYLDNDGVVIPQYQSQKDYIAPEWQPLVQVLDKIVRRHSSQNVKN